MIPLVKIISTPHIHIHQPPGWEPLFCKMEKNCSSYHRLGHVKCFPLSYHTQREKKSPFSWPTTKPHLHQLLDQSFCIIGAAMFSFFFFLDISCCCCQDLIYSYSGLGNGFWTLGKSGGPPLLSQLISV